MMMATDCGARIETVADLEALYGAVAPPSVVKEVDHIHPIYRPFIEAAPFAVLATRDRADWTRRRAATRPVSS
jgi:predicted pyridoxine 5'-phosphate oxidase superfamily flavin-nucleotide-binding protein